MQNRTNYRLLTILIMIAISQGVNVRAADDAGSTTATPPEKLKVIKEMLVASRTTRNARLGFDLIFGQQIRGITTGISERIDKNPMLTSSQRADAKRAATEALKRRSDRFSKLVTEELHLDQAIEQAFIPMFDQHFTIQELKEMLAYYNSPIGQKSLDLLPAMSIEAAMKLNAQLVPKLKEISAQIDAEERAAIESKLNDPANNAHKAVPESKDSSAPTIQQSPASESK